MIIRLFDVQNKVVVPSEHIYIIKDLKVIMDEFPEHYLKIYEYLFYMTCPNPDMNPFFFTPEEEREELILRQLDVDFSLDSETITKALALCKKLYETPSMRAYEGIKMALDNIAKYMSITTITDGRDGNIAQIGRIAKDFDEIRQSYKGTLKDLLEEQKSHVRGGHGMAYDQ